MISVPRILQAFSECGFDAVHCESIGAHVFPGFQKWIDQTKCEESWGPIWLQGYQQKLIDYYVITARKP
jgi:hypothetical protein